MKRALHSVLALLLGTIPFTASADPGHLDLDFFKHDHHHHDIPVVPEVNVGLLLIPIAFVILLFASRRLLFKRVTR
jgi:hypothetical protein